MRKLFVLLFIITAVKPKAQDFPTPAFIENLGDNTVYFVAQAHNNKANTLIEQQMLFSLNKTYGVRYDIIEYAHSAAFLINLYLETGEERFLSLIDKNAGFGFIKAVKLYNDKLPDDKKISFYGLDFEGKYTKDALDIILQLTEIAPEHPLHILLKNIVEAEDAEVRPNIFKLKEYVAAREQDSRDALGRFYVDVMLIANALYGFGFMIYRDDTMYANFKKLHRELLLKDASPKFFAAFGYGHTNPDNRDGFAMQLLSSSSSPAKDRVSITATQYINCEFGTKTRDYKRPNSGSLDFLCKPGFDKRLKVKGEGKTAAITVLSKDELKALPCNNNTKYLSGVIIVKNFGPTNVWTWE